MKNYSGIAFSGAGVCGILYAGAVSKLIELGAMKDIKTFIGSSAGSYIAALLALGYTPVECKDKMMNYDISKLEHVNIFEFFWSNWGFTRGKRVDNFISYILGDYKDITFDEVYKKTGNNLVIVATNVSKEVATFFDKDTSPDMKISQALRMSSSIPFMWPAVKYQGDLYVDGACSCDLPLDYFKPDEIVIGLRYMGPKTTDIKTVFDFAYGVIETMIEHYVPDKNVNHDIVQLPSSISSTNFKITKNEMETLYQEGYDIITNYFN